ncbi:hypothetical protein [Alloalcanivorax mobilis]|uniref:hypothetical protein n=1 Tax=Alloalcanivorax mobilis TaxID=2019569 RepID=UPI0013000E14|nr:hypothetical protein [Alloalcanivorax mobilis]
MNLPFQSRANEKDWIFINRATNLMSHYGEPLLRRHLLNVNVKLTAGYAARFSSAQTSFTPFEPGQKF